MREILLSILVFLLLSAFLSSSPSDQNSDSSATEGNGLPDDRPTPDAQSNLDTTTPHPVAEGAVESAVEDPTLSATDAAPTPSIAVPIPLLELEPEVDVSLATSLPLQEAIHPETIHSDLVADRSLSAAPIIEAAAEGDTQQAPDRDHQTVLEEIAQLDGASHETTIAQLTRYINHPNPMVRSTAAMTLGELAAKNQGELQKDVIALLNALLQDSHSEVRSQAATVLGKLTP